jgi:hypothetical protein
MLQWLFGKSKESVPAKRKLSPQEESRRMAGCKQVVLEYADALGFIARESITRDELEKLIHEGIDPDDLSREIRRRIDEKPGIILGDYHYANGQTQIKIPHSLRDRHTYIIGKSGSGKTNLIRLMAMQDIDIGHGIGMLAPEQELITEEILPYIPEERIDDVVYFNPANMQSPIPLNPLYLDDDADIDLCVDDNLTIFKRLMGETQVRMDEILRQSLYALLAHPGSTLLDVEKLLSPTDDSFRKEIINASQDEQTRYFLNKAPCGRTLSTSTLSSGASPLRGGGIRTAFDPLSLVIDHPIRWVQDAPHPHLTPTVRTDQRVPSRTLLVPLPIG